MYNRGRENKREGMKEGEMREGGKRGRKRQGRKDWRNRPWGQGRKESGGKDRGEGWDIERGLKERKVQRRELNNGRKVKNPEI